MTNYNLTNLTNSSTLGGLVTYANESSGGYLVGMFLVAFFFIMLFSLKRWDFVSSLLASSWTAFILGLLLSFGGYVNPLFTLGFLIVAALTALYLWTTGQ